MSSRVRRHRNIRNAIANLVQVPDPEEVRVLAEDEESIADIVMDEPEIGEIEEHEGVNNEDYPLPEHLPLVDNLNEELINEPVPVMDREDICKRLRKIYHERGLTHEAVRDVANLLNDLGHNIPKDPR